MIIKNIWDAIESTKTSTSIARITTTAEKIIMDGYPISIIISLLQKYILTVENLSDTAKAEISIILANADKKVSDGCDEELTLLSTCCSIAKAL